MEQSLTLYYSPGACSLATHIALQEAGAAFEFKRVTLADAEHLKPDFLAVNPKARLPALATPDRVLTENIALLNFIADLFGKDGSVPRDDAYRGARCNELLAWFSSTVHISFAQFWRPERFSSDEAVKAAIVAGGRTNLARDFVAIEREVGAGWLVPDRFTAADSYALTFFRWGRRIGFDMAEFPNWARLCERTLAIASVQRAISAEGLSIDEFRLG
jgi:glutathione S-transferase